MALTTGTRLGPYEIVAPLGAGGMGEVYRARDPKLNREVAIKVLPAAVADDADRLVRLSREAHVLASLNHPNIAQIYGLEDSSGLRALVMELVEGQTLADRIRSGSIPLDDALSIAKQIAEALEAAHDQGIIHRDLKPANIKIRDDGIVKVLDFGLAKAMAPVGGSNADAANSPTLSMHATQSGVILGTAAYMSPEQASGKTVDRRADIWAFGCVLFEMLTGHRVFAGANVTETIANVLKVEPVWERLPGHVPARIHQVLRGCLQKDPKQRMHDVADVRLALEGAFEIAAPGTTAAAPRGRRTWIAAFAVATVVIAALAVSVMPYLLAPPPEPLVTRFTIPLPDGVTLTSQPAVSPDGTRVVFAGGGALFVRPLDALAAQRLPATEGAQAPFWSPDSKGVAFFADGKLKKVDIAGGPAVTICEAEDAEGASWSSKGVIVFAPDDRSGLQQVPAAGGTPTPATILDPATQATSHRWPQFLPDGEHFLYLSLATQGDGVFVTSLGSPTSTLLVSTGRQAAYAAPGTLLFVRGTTLMRQPFDTAGLRLTGDPAPVAEGVRRWVGPSLASFSVSDKGVLVYTTQPARLPRRLVWVDRRGSVTPLALAPAAYDNPALSPDGRYVVLSVEGHIWVYDIARGTLGRRTFGAAGGAYPIWTRDGKFLIFSRGLPTGSLMRVPADGSGTEEPLVTDVQFPGMKLATSWSADGRLLAIHDGDHVVVRDTDGVFGVALKTSAWSAEGRFAPTGGWLAYTGGETGRSEVYVQSYPPGAGKWQISTEGGSQPMWAPNGRELFYRIGDRMMVVDVELHAAFKASTPRVLFEMPLSTFGPDDPQRFSVTSDAQRFLLLTPAPVEKATAAEPPLTVVLNWAQALKR